ncbi:RecX family transcriptional regulator [Candidatus Gracilibacteria bacterium]|jgi:regulatory protein|nr:RecX family transcriptional regulator [Candidatus Gracilibacteria bacterium]
MNNKIVNKSRLLDYSLRLVSKKRYTVSEIKKKLSYLCKNHPEIEVDIINEVINRLLELKYLDDTEFVKDYVLSRIQFKPRGISLIKQELRVKGIHKNIIEGGFENIDYDESKACEDLIQKKMKLWTKHPAQKRKEKAFQFLASRGFSKEAIYTSLKSCYSSDREQDY